MHLTSERGIVEERSYPPSDSGLPKQPKTRLIALIFLIILVAIFVPILVSVSPFTSVLLSLFIFVPMALLLLIAACAYCMGGSLNDIDKETESRIFESMRRRASPADHVEDLDRYRCSECKMSFELSYAEVVDDKVVLCPLCGTRLFIE